jgi:hypothetical protein
MITLGALPWVLRTLAADSPYAARNPRRVAVGARLAALVPFAVAVIGVLTRSLIATGVIGLVLLVGAFVDARVLGPRLLVAIAVTPFLMFADVAVSMIVIAVVGALWPVPFAAAAVVGALAVARPVDESQLNESHENADSCASV